MISVNSVKELEEFLNKAGVDYTYQFTEDLFIVVDIAVEDAEAMKLYLKIPLAYGGYSNRYLLYINPYDMDLIYNKNYTHQKEMPFDSELIREGIINPEILTLKDYAEILNNERTERLCIL